MSKKFLAFHQEIFGGILVRAFQMSRGTSWRENFELKNLIPSGVFLLWTNEFQAHGKKKFRKLVKTAFSLSREKFWRKLPPKKLWIYNNFEFWRKNFCFLTKNFRQDSQKSVLRVQRTKRWKERSVWKNKIHYHFQTSCKKVSGLFS